MFDQLFQGGELNVAEVGDMTIGKGAEQNVIFLHSHVMTAKPNTFSGGIEAIWVHETSTSVIDWVKEDIEPSNLSVSHPMRPQIIFPLFASCKTLPGVGPKVAEHMERLAGPHVLDLLWHLPSGLVDRRYSPKIEEAPSGSIVTLDVRVEKHVPSQNRRQPYKVLCADETGYITLVFFHARGDYLAKLLPEGEERVVSGKIERFGTAVQMVHPDHIVTLDEKEAVCRVEPTYPMTGGLAAKTLRKAILAAIQQVPDLPEWNDEALLKREGWPSWKTAVCSVHEPQVPEDMEGASPVRQRLAYDELLANQLALALVRLNMRKTKGRPISDNGVLRAKVVEALPFALTGAQQTALEEISTDMASSSRMLRLLHGDVGSGKTVVALLSMLIAVEQGSQAALMAPTEVLARQHMETIAPLVDAVGLKVALLTGREKGKVRREILEALEGGSIQLIVGTHALFQEDVVFNDLALAVIDEQHRFGVHQRLTLASKGEAVDMLVMTATPIPRTLMLTAYGDMDVSRLTEKPAGRKPIKTVTIPSERLEEVIAAASRAMDDGRKIYWICPLVEESEKLDAAAAEERFRYLQGIFGSKVGLVHGRMKGPEKDAAMEAFSKGGVDLLVATTVVEVGVDVPQASVMVIEHAERFGLAQLHQLRGRIGRGEAESSCLLLYSGPLGETAKERLKVMRETNDGFVIAEKDLKLRGAGELLGTRQSGLPEFRLADLAKHDELLPMARDDASLILANDPSLESNRGQALRTLLYLFERDAAIRFLRSG